MHEEPRWPIPVGLGVVGLVVLANAASEVGLGTSGNALVVTVSVAVFCVAAVVFLLWFDAPPPVTIALLLVMGFAATATHHGGPTGTGGIGLYLGVAFAPLRLPVRTAAVVSAARVDVRLVWAPERVCLVVENRGGQIAEGQLDAEIAASGSGYGLTGLAERARLLGGELDAGPTASGFRVALRVPLAHHRPRMGGNGMTIRVLVVDDQRIVREGLAHAYEHGLAP